MKLANLTKTISNSLRVYSAEPTTKWNAFLWGTGTWTWRDVEWTYYKGILDSISVATANGFDVTHLISELISLGTIISREFGHQIYETVGLSSAITNVNVINNGWILSKGEEQNALNWPVSSFSLDSDSITAWSENTSPTTTWVQS